MRKILAISAFWVLSCTSSFAFGKHNSTYNLCVTDLVNSNLLKTDTVYIDLRNDPDFKFETNLRWFQDSNMALFGIKKGNGELFIEPLFYQIESFVDGVSIVSYDDYQGAINSKGDIVIPYVYQELQTSSEEMIAFYKDGLWGFFNTKGDEVVSAEYEFADSFSDGLALVSKNQLFGYINAKGRVVIPFQFDYASSFENGEAQVQLKSKTFTINTKGIRIAD